jgi:hypothetical protein
MLFILRDCSLFDRYWKSAVKYSMEQYKQQHPNLQGMPRANWITLGDSHSRQQYMRDQFSSLGVRDHVMHTAQFDGRVHDYQNDPNVVSKLKHIENINSAGIATALSHAWMIRTWLETTTATEHPLGLFMEDDMDLGLCDLWPFTWKWVMAQWPRDCEIMQLSLIRNDDLPDWLMHHPQKRFKGNWGAGVYMLTRAQAQRIVGNTFLPDGTICMDIEENPWAWPCVEHTIIRQNDLCWTWPLFCEQITIKSTQPRGEDIGQHKSARAITDFWRRVAASPNGWILRD